MTTHVQIAGVRDGMHLTHSYINLLGARLIGTVDAWRAAPNGGNGR